MNKDNTKDSEVNEVAKPNNNPDNLPPENDEEQK